MLATRMRLAGQLDDRAFQAVELDARRVANRLSRDRDLDRGLAALAATAAELAPPFTPGAPEAENQPLDQPPRR